MPIGKIYQPAPRYVAPCQGNAADGKGNHALSPRISRVTNASAGQRISQANSPSRQDRPTGLASPALPARISNVTNATPTNSLAPAQRALPLGRTNESASAAPPTEAYIYVPFCNQDMVLSAMAVNVPRVLQGKPPYPLLTTESVPRMQDQIRNFLDSDILKIRNISEFSEKLKPFLSKKDIEALYKARPTLIKRIGEYLALKQMTVVSMQTANVSVLRKIYISGHGQAGVPAIASDLGKTSKMKTVNELAGDLKGLLIKAERTIDLRLLACEGADRETAISMDKAYLAENTKSVDQSKPLAQHMSDALSNQGVNARVFGYHGLHASRSEGHLHQAVTLNGDRDKNRNVFFRASEFRREFFPKTKT